MKHSLYVPAIMFDEYSGGMFAVLYGGSNAKDAVDACEQSSDETAKTPETLEVTAESGDSGSEDMLARLASRLSILGADAENDDVECSVLTEGQRVVKFNPFSGKGGGN